LPLRPNDELVIVDENPKTTGGMEGSRGPGRLCGERSLSGTGAARQPVCPISLPPWALRRASCVFRHFKRERSRVPGARDLERGPRTGIPVTSVALIVRFDSRQSP
jgi:hypothetical protein